MDPTLVARMAAVGVPVERCDDVWQSEAHHCRAHGTPLIFAADGDEGWVFCPACGVLRHTNEEE